MRSRLLQTTLVVLSMFLSVCIVPVNANGQTAGALPSDVIAANRELDHQLLEGHRLLDAEKVMGLFTSSPDIFFIAPDGELYKGPDQVRQAWVRFFASLQSILGHPQKRHQGLSSRGLRKCKRLKRIGRGERI